MLHATVEEMIVVTTSDAEKLAEALLCDGPGRFSVSWHGDIMLSLTLFVSNGSSLDVAGFSESTDNADTGAAVISDGGSILIFEADLGITLLSFLATSHVNIYSRNVLAQSDKIVFVIAEGFGKDSLLQWVGGGLWQRGGTKK